MVYSIFVAEGYGTFCLGFSALKVKEVMQVDCKMDQVKGDALDCVRGGRLGRFGLTLRFVAVKFGVCKCIAKWRIHRGVRYCS